MINSLNMKKLKALFVCEYKYLGGIDESPCVEQTEAMLMAVSEPGPVLPPVCTVVTLS